MSEKKRCTCDKHKGDHHKEMTKTESLEHAKECLTSTIERLECIKDVFDKISIEEQNRAKQGRIPAKGYDRIEFQIKIEIKPRKK